MDAKQIQEALAILQNAALGNSATSTTFADLWNHFVKRRDVNDRTFETYKSLWLNHVADKFGDRQAIAITPDEIKRWRDELKDAGYPPATRNRIVGVIRSLIKHGVEYRLVPLNPLPKNDKEQEHNAREVVITELDIERILEFIDSDYYVRKGEHAYKVGVFILFCVEEGMRREEACGVEWPHIDLHYKAISVTKKTAKMQKQRTVPLRPRTEAWLRKIPRTGRWVLMNEATGLPFKADHWEKQWQYIRGRLGYDHVTLHDLRRSFVTLARRRGIPETVVMKLSGHASHEVFKRYAIVGPEDLDDALGKLERGRLREIAEYKAEQRKRGPRAKSNATS